MYNYYVIELQSNADGTSGNFVWGFVEKIDAETKYLATRAACAVSSIMIHTVLWIDNKGIQIEKKSYTHPVETPEEE